MKNNILPTSMMVFMLFAYMSSYVNKKAGPEIVVSDYEEPNMRQEVPVTNPLFFTPDFLSTDSYEFGGTFCPGGNELYFSKWSRSNAFDYRIYQTRPVDGKRTKPEPASGGLNPIIYSIYTGIP